MRSLRWRRLGLRREVLILLPSAILLLIVLSTFTLFAYRNSLKLLAEERRGEAARLARSAVVRLPADRLPTPQELRQLAPGARGVFLIDPGGRILVAAGEVPPGDPLAPLQGERPGGAFAMGPHRELPDSVVAFAPAASPQGDSYLRLDLSAGTLARQRRSAGVLAAVVLTVNTALGVLLILFLRNLLAPYETLLQRAREVGGGEEAAEDEAKFLVSTFERALTALQQEAWRRADEDIAALQRTLTASIESGLLLLDREGRVLALNPVGAALLGTEAPEAPTPASTLLQSHPQIQVLLQEVMATRRAIQRHECTVEVEGEARILGLTVHPLRRDDGSVRGYLVLFADLTEVQRRAGEERLAASLAQLGELAAGVAHELRNSLATLRGYLTLVERDPDGGSVADYLAEIRAEADRLQRVLEDFLVFARPESVRLERVELADLLHHAASDPALIRVEVELALEASRGVRISGDPHLLERALRNLLRNAAEAEGSSREPGSIQVRTEATPEGLEVVIEDRGPGLPEEVRRRLFQPFNTGRSGGVGLGLALAHRIVILHGGRLRLEDRPGGGTQARILFPRDTFVT